MKKNNFFLKISVLVAYVAMIGVNFLANALPIGGVTTGEASDSFPNLFTPAGVTFSIWGLIYLLLLVYTVYQFSSGKKNDNPNREIIFKKINQYYLATSFANIAWIFAWHHGIIWLSVLIMLVFLVLLIKIADILNKERFSLRDNLCIRAPFSIYFGWITVATIANITAFLVNIGWNGFGISEIVWTIVILLVGAAIGTLRAYKDKNIFYVSVLVWAYSGILLKHVTVSGFNGNYPSIIATIFLCIVIFLGMIGFLVFKQFSKKVVK